MQPIIRSNGNSPKKPLPKQVPDFGASVNSVIETVANLKATEREIKAKTEAKLEEIDKVLSSTTEAINAINDVKKQAIEHIKSIQPEKGEDGEDGDDADPVDEDKIVESVLARIPKPQVIDEKKIVKIVLKSLPKKSGDLKIIQEKVEVDPMEIIDKILALPEDKFRLTTKHIDGLQQTIDAIKSQIGQRGYLHGGGDTVVAGTNIFITTNKNGQKVISSTLPVLAGVTSLNSLTGAVTLAAGPNITLTPVGQTITINANNQSPSIGGPITGGTDGSVLYVHPNSTIAQLAIGSSGQVLTVVGGQPAWTTISSGGANFPHNTDILDMTGGTGGITADIANSILYQGSAAKSLDWAGRILYDQFGTGNIDYSGNTTLNSVPVPKFIQGFAVSTYGASPFGDFYVRGIYADSAFSSLTIDPNSGHLLNSNITTVDWAQQFLQDASGNIKVEWSANRLIDSNNLKVDWGSACLLYDNSGNAVVDWQNKLLKTSLGNTVLNWSSQQAGTGATTAGYTQNSSSNQVYAESTFQGSGASGNAYSITDIVTALKNYGLLA